MSTNKHGLARHIPNTIKREIRQLSKFGCVICRCGIYEYEHIVPEYNDAREHDPLSMCLLCGRCHNKVTKGILSKETVLSNYKKVQENETVKQPWESFDLDSANITVKIGTCTFKNSTNIIKLGNKNLLSINPPKDGNCFPSISATFTDNNGNEILSIEDNEWIGSNKCWDIETIGSELTIRKSKGDIVLKIKVNPPHEIEVVILDIQIGNSHLTCKNGDFKLKRLYSDSEYSIDIKYLECYGAMVGLEINEDIFKEPNFTSFTMVGGQGIELIGTGIKLGNGSGKFIIRGITIEEATKEFTKIIYLPLIEDLSVETKVLPPRL